MTTIEAPKTTPKEVTSLSVNGMVLHRCSPTSYEGCDCGYDPLCTGKFHRRLVRMPRVLDVMARPGWYWRVWRVRRLLRQAAERSRETA